MCLLVGYGGLELVGKFGLRLLTRLSQQIL
jgi:hypothetical protein